VHDHYILMNFQGVFYVTWGCVEDHRPRVTKFSRLYIVYNSKTSLVSVEPRVQISRRWSFYVSEMVGSNHPCVIVGKNF